MLVIASLCSGYAFAADTIKVDNPQVRAMLPGAKVGGGNLSVSNTGGETDRLISVTSDRAKSVQIHHGNWPFWRSRYCRTYILFSQKRMRFPKGSWTSS
jgi:hypothetical protein